MRHILGFLIFLVVLDAHAGCGRIPVHVSGRVIDASGKAIAGAYVMTTWQELSAFVQQGEVRTGKDGRYSITLYFNPVMGYDLDRGHDCSGKLKSIVFAVSVRNYESQIEHREISGSELAADFVVHRLGV